jgi:hypothetical protein
VKPAVRYTRPLWQFIRDHTSLATAEMIAALGSGDHLPEGPDPEIHTLAADADASALVESILARWKKSGLCDSSDVLILHTQSDIAKSPLITFNQRQPIEGRERRIMGVAAWVSKRTGSCPYAQPFHP